MTQVRDFRADAPAPDRARLAPGRTRLTEAAQGQGRTRRLRADWRLAAVGAAVAVTAAALLVAGTVGGDGSPDRVTPGTSQTALGDAAEVLGRAADTVERYDPVSAPGTGQWIYEKTMSQSSGGWPGGSKEPPRTDEEWMKYADPRFENWKEGDDHSPRERFRFIQQLPDDPAELLKKAREFYPSGEGENEPRAQHDFRALSVLLDTYPMPPEGLAKVYRALATVPGVDVGDRLVQDVAGRDAIAVYLDVNARANQRPEILIDPSTYELVGQRWVVLRDYEEQYPDGETPPRPWKAGDIVDQSARLETAVVDAKGERP
ncbi:CU044_5270 family protein [Streptomyces sp. NPDC050704]|uniref:CU044_5270 family protein n=1 Tax=Streptomyces sp. NPDC050704 TaxID=3157219 RepID=UPI003441FB84